MTDPHLIGPVPESTPGYPGGKRKRALPYDVLKDASKRLEIMALLAATLWILGTIGDRVALVAMNHGDMGLLRWQAPDVICVISVVVSLALFFYIRQGDRDPQFLLDLGLVYMVFTGLSLALLMHWAAVPKEWPVFSIISWVGPVVLMCAAIVPNSPLKTLLAGLLAVSMNPIAMLIAKARGVWEFGSVGNVLVMHYPDYLLVGVAVVISHVMTKLGQQVTKAREMGSYRLINRLGQGGMGEVWLARHHMLARDAAIKLIQPDALRRSSGGNATLIRKRFEQEARTTASLRSPHTVELYDFGVTRDGVFYYVMELLDGIDLDTLVRKFGPQPPARVVHILRQVCRSLHEAHQRGIVHRDIKPTNIFLCRMGNEYDFAKVLDFGLVKLINDQETQLTGEGVTTGTPAYMAPELAMGNTQVDGRSDLYGLGCVAYWLLTGKLVFEENGAAAMMIAHLQKTPVPPSQRSVSGVPACLDQAIMTCLQKKPLDRFSDTQVLARMLDACNVGAWSVEDAQDWWENNLSADTPAVGSSGPTMEIEPQSFPTM
jgi:eukaryotic-like serine/threonine-protein kinase